MAIKIATVRSRANGATYDVAIMGSRYRCNCLHNFYHPDVHCKHIERVLDPARAGKAGEMFSATVEPTPHGIEVVKRHRQAHGLPLVRG